MSHNFKKALLCIITTISIHRCCHLFKLLTGVWSRHTEHCPSLVNLQQTGEAGGLDTCVTAVPDWWIAVSIDVIPVRRPQHKCRISIINTPWPRCSSVSHRRVPRTSHTRSWPHIWRIRCLATFLLHIENIFSQTANHCVMSKTLQ